MAYAERVTALAKAEAASARAASLADGNEELIAAASIVEDLPAMVTAAAQGISGANLTVLNGAEGVSQLLTGIVGQGLTILDTLRATTTAPHGATTARQADATTRQGGVVARQADVIAADSAAATAAPSPASLPPAEPSPAA